MGSGLVLGGEMVKHVYETYYSPMFLELGGDLTKTRMCVLCWSCWSCTTQLEQKTLEQMLGEVFHHMLMLILPVG